MEDTIFDDEIIEAAVKLDEFLLELVKQGFGVNAINGIINSVDRQLDNINEQQNLGMPSPFLQIPQIQAATGSYVIHARKKEEDIKDNEEILLEIQNDSGYV